MKPAAFEYDRPPDLPSAVALLAEHGDEAKVLAGGQSLVPLLNFRLLRVARLIDVNDVGALSYIVRRDGVLRVGALARQRHLEVSPLVRRDWPLLAEAVGHVGHPQIRNRGTIGGSVSHADPAAELPAALAALDARFVIESASGSRTVPWREFFASALTTTLRADELLVEVQVPALPPGAGSAFCEFALRHGDFAQAAAAAVVSVDGSGRCDGAALALLGADSTPVRSAAGEERLLGAEPAASAAEAAAAAVNGITPRDDAHASSEQRRALLEHLARRAIETAAARAAAPA